MDASRILFCLGIFENEKSFSFSSLTLLIWSFLHSEESTVRFNRGSRSPLSGCICKLNKIICKMNEAQHILKVYERNDKLKAQKHFFSPRGSNFYPKTLEHMTFTLLQNSLNTIRG